jgi:predicted esterase
LIACPRGRAVSELEPRGFYYPDHHALEAEVLAVVLATEEKYGRRLAKESAAYSGYSQGATMGALFIPRHAARFSRLILTEGGYSEWTQQSANTFHREGGSRVLFVCGTRHCATNSAKSSMLLEHAGVQARVENVPGGGHTDEGRVGERLDALADWALAWQP